MNKFVYPYKVGSKSAANLAKGLGAKRIRHERSKYKGKENNLVINWGSSNLPQAVLDSGVVLNPPEKVVNASNKLSFFRMMAEHPEINTPRFSNNLEEAIGWERTIVARQKLTGHSGEGIVLFEPHEEGVKAPLYVEYVPKKEEYRVHVIGGKAVSVQRKAKRNDVNNDDVNWRVRNHKNGFIFARNEERDIPEGVENQAVLACNAVGLDFGAVDVIWNKHRNTVYVLEVNCAPGLEGTTLEEYTKEINQRW